MGRHVWALTCFVVSAALLICSVAWGEPQVLLQAPSAPEVTAPEAELSEVVVQAPEPRFAAPTLRDRIGRVWAPVLINGRGPFRMVLDTGASDSAITAPVAAAL